MRVLFLGLFLCMGLLAEDIPQIRVDARFVEITTRADWPDAVRALVDENAEGKLSFKSEGGPSSAQVRFLTEREKVQLFDVLAQVPGADVLSTPRVVARDKQQAKIEIVREIIFPTKIETMPAKALDVDAGSDWIVIEDTAMRPAGFEKIPLGVICEVQPERIEDAIKLELSVEVNEEVEVESAALDYKLQSGEARQYEFEQPVVLTRNVKGSYTLASDQTLLAMTEVVESEVEVKGRIAVLGYIPLLGRLFTTRRIEVEKRLLLIHVSAEEVKR